MINKGLSCNTQEILGLEMFRACFGHVSKPCTVLFIALGSSDYANRFNMKMAVKGQ